MESKTIVPRVRQTNMGTTQLSVLKLDFPCQMPWDEMQPVGADGAVRHCSQCALDVTDLSTMTTDEAEAFLTRRGSGRTCVSFMRDANAAIVTLDYQKRGSTRRKWPLVAAAATMAIAAGGGAAYYRATKAQSYTAMGGAIAASRPSGYSPFNSTTSQQTASQRRLLPIQLKGDASLKPLVDLLPSGVEVIDLKYNVYPLRLMEDGGTCVVLGSPASDSLDSQKAATVHAVVWLMPIGYSSAETSDQTGEPHPVHFVGRSDSADVLIWSDDAELEREILAGLLSPPAMPATSPAADSREE